ncbi:Multidrug resistance protein ABC Superfamily [Phytophthora cinnamomi]|uniref:Multidrug resistance protein ABC Superfamily n=1 Tax=Phytophthora cinnamomi TaxID=4785 RepID=UPI003559CCDB|nr:Multidrug resistance protein ABC Superfamily [Phytophthora cinnamomi]
MAASELLPLKSYDTFDHSLSKRGASPHPQDAAGCCSRLLLDWVRPLLTLGQRRQLHADDVWPLRWELQATTASFRFAGAYEASQSMYRAAFACFGRRIALTGVAFLVSMLCNLLGPVVLREVVSSLSALTEQDPEDETPILQTVCVWVGALFAAKVLQALADNYARFYSEVIAIKLVASVKTLMFRKTLKLSAEARRDKSTGAITNMYTADSDAILDTAFLIHQLWLIPLQIAIVSYMLYDVLGVAAFAGRVYRRSKDVRMKKVTEVFKAVEIVKFNAWEDQLMGQIKETRAQEMKHLFKRRLLACLSVVMLWGMPVFISVASFGVYTGVLHRSLTPAIVFTSIALFQLIQGPLRMITNIVPMLVQSKVALERISAFLKMPELEPDNVMPFDHPDGEKYIIKKVDRFQVTNSVKLDENNKIWYGQLCVSQWFSLHIQLVGSLLVLVVTVSLVLLRHQLGAAVIGLAFSYALKVSQNLERLVQALSQVEPMMVSPERLQEYADIVQEAPSRLPLDPPSKIHPEAWPSNGIIEFKHVSFRYKDQGQLVLRDLNFSVRGGEKLGIVGRTGAGKSSLTMALFRINELTTGSILIDGVDVSTIGLTSLREKLSIIPQNPVLFKGTLRNYLDPFGDFSDDQLWACLRQVGLGSRVEAEDGKLDALVEENGENFSVGERQMLCMVCSLLRKSRIVIFDEATAAVDHATDQALQRVIREVFKESTVLTIAHRLDTILDSDRILVMDDGCVKELASPAALVQKGKGHFFDLMEEGGYLDRFQEENTVEMPNNAP